MAAPPPCGTETITTQRKRLLRAALRRRRAALAEDEHRRRSDAAAVRLWQTIGGLDGPVAVFWPLAREIDILPVIQRLLERDGHVLLPRQQGAGLPLALHWWRRGDPLHEGPHKVMEPLASAPLGEPRLAVVPLLGFDEQGRRLGYGGGFYDRTLQRLRATTPALLAVGYAFELQAAAEIPVERCDERLDCVVTDVAVRRFARTRVPAGD